MLSGEALPHGGAPHPQYDQYGQQQLHAYPTQNPQNPAFSQQQTYPQQTAYFQQQAQPAFAQPAYDQQLDVSDQTAHSKKRRLGQEQSAEQPFGEEFETGELGELPLVDIGVETFKQVKNLKLTNAIEEIARKGRSLSYDAQTNTYTVLDGLQFEEEFNALRTTRTKLNDAAKDRPFSRMHRFYVLLQGEKWASTGSVFAPKDSGTTGVALLPTQVHNQVNSNRSTPVTVANRASPAESAGASHVGVTADNVALSIVGNNGLQTISLQHFLDVTGAGALYASAIAQQGASYQPSMSTGAAAAGPWFTPEQLQAPLETGQVSQVVGGVWNASSKGDQAYFFKRQAAQPPLPNGAIVGIMRGEVVADDVYVRHRSVGDEGPDEEAEEGVGGEERGLWMVVSDENAKWKGEPLPTAEEEAEGHWCCFLGQVPVRVDGRVRTGDHIGPKCDGTGTGMVVRAGQAQPVIGIALADKHDHSPGIVKVLCFAGLNALSEGTASPPLAGLLDRMAETERRVAALDAKVRDVEGTVHDVEMGVATTRGEVEELAARLSLMERFQFWRPRRDPHPHDERRYSAPRAEIAVVGVPLAVSNEIPMQYKSTAACGQRQFLCGMLLLLLLLAVGVGVWLALGGRGSDGEECIEGACGAGSGLKLQVSTALQGVSVHQFSANEASFVEAVAHVLQGNHVEVAADDVEVVSVDAVNLRRLLVSGVLVDYEVAGFQTSRELLEAAAVASRQDAGLLEALRARPGFATLTAVSTTVAAVDGGQPPADVHMSTAAPATPPQTSPSPATPSQSTATAVTTTTTAGTTAAASPGSTPAPTPSPTRLSDLERGRWWKICPVGRHPGACVTHATGETVAWVPSPDQITFVDYMWELYPSTWGGQEVMSIRAWTTTGSKLFFNIGEETWETNVAANETTIGSHWILTEQGSVDGTATRQWTIANAARHPGTYFHVGAAPYDLRMWPAPLGLGSYWTIEEALPTLRIGAMDGVYEWCADEGTGVCRCDGSIRYGVPGAWTYRSTSGVESPLCDNSVFGDPALHTAKWCDCRAEGYVRQKLEGDTDFRCEGTLAYGSGGQFLFRSTNGLEVQDCTNDNFGEDPAPGTIKACYCKPP